MKIQICLELVHTEKLGGENMTFSSHLYDQQNICNVWPAVKNI